MEILYQNPGTTTIKRRRADKENEFEEVAISNETVVYTNRKELP